MSLERGWLGVALALSLICVPAWSAPSPLPLSLCNNETHFECHDASRPCIPMEWECDNVADCPNGKDEQHCAYLHSCERGLLMCRNGECVSARYRCDGQIDCSDGSDERACEENNQLSFKISGSLSESSTSSPFSDAAPRSLWHSHPECPISDYTCQSGQCIVGSAKCDGVWDCPYGDDEKECPKKSKNLAVPLAFAPASQIDCREGHVACADGNACIPSKWVCDGSMDCDDGSDETTCNGEEDDDLASLLDDDLEGKLAQFLSSDHEDGKRDDKIPTMHEFLQNSADVLCAEGQFRCKGGKCIPASSACDGKADCPLSDDEGGRCGECSSSSKCSHSCRDTPNGGVCTCRAGSRLSPDGETCDDIDECLFEGRRCSQFCENRKNGYECTCAPEYVLGSDRHTCHLESSNERDGLIYVSLTSEIRAMPLFSPMSTGAGYNTLFSTAHHGTSRSLALLNKENKMFLAIHNGKKGELGMVRDGALHLLRENVTGIGFVAVDWVGGNVFYTARSTSPVPGIHVCTSSGLFCRRIIEGKKTELKQDYLGLAVNPNRGIIAWIDVYGSQHRIMTANLDGSNIRVAVEHKLEYPSAITFDIIKNDLYFADVDKKLIEKINLDTMERSVVLSAGVQHPYSMAFFNGFIYWTDWGTENLKVAALGMAHSSPHLIHSFNLFPYGIALNHSKVQPALSGSPCDDVACPWMCVAVPHDEYDPLSSLEARCICPDEYMDNEDYDPKVSGSVPCKLRKRDAIQDLKMSHVSVSLMREYCEEERACVNGGACVEHKNPSGRVDRVTCKCAKGYSGLSCEIDTTPAKKDDEDMADAQGQESQEENGGVSMMSLVIIVLVALLAGGCFYYSRRNPDHFSEMRRSTLTRVSEARLPERAAAVIKTSTQKAANIGSSFSKTPTTTTSYSTSANDAPLAVPSAGKTAGSESTAAAFANPTFDLHSAAHAPYSGYHDMNTTEASYFDVQRTDDAASLRL